MIRTLLALLAATFSLLPLRADNTLQHYLDSEAELVLSIRSISDIRSQWDAHPFARIWKQHFHEIFEEMSGASIDEAAASESSFEVVLQDEFGLTVEELYEMIPGQACLALYNWVELLTNDMDEEFQSPLGPDAVVLIEYAGDEDELHRLMDIQFHRNWEIQKELNPLIEHTMIEERFMGETLYFDERFNGEESVIEDAYALVDGIFILASPAERLRSTVEAIKDGLDNPLDEEDAYLRAREEGGRGDCSVYLNLAAIMPELNEVLFNESIDSSMAMVGVTSKSLSDALALDASEALFGDFDVEPDGILCSAGLIYSEKRGLLELLAYESDGLPAARFVPESTLTAALSSFNLSEMLANLEKVVRIASPTMVPLLDIQLAQVKNSTGIDLRSALLDNFDGGIVSMASMPENTDVAGLTGQPEQLLMMEIKDAQSLDAALEALKDLVPMVKPMLKQQDYQGYTIYSFSDASGIEASEQISYTITRDRLIVCVGRVGYLQTVLTRLDAGGAGLWEADDTELLFERIAQPQAVTRSYMDLSQYMNTMLQTLSKTMMLEQFLPGFSLASLPSEVDAELRMVSEVNEASDGFFTRVLLIDLEAEGLANE